MSNASNSSHIEAMQLLKGRLTSGFVFLRGWFLMVWSLLVFFARGFRCCSGRVHSNRLHTHTRGNRCRLLLLPTHRENNQFRCLLLISTQNDQHFYKHTFYSWKMLKKTVLTHPAKPTLWESVKAETTEASFKLKVQRKPLFSKYEFI